MFMVVHERWSENGGSEASLDIIFTSHFASDTSVADPGFPVGGTWTSKGGDVDSRGGYVSKILYVETKESGPLGGGGVPGANVHLSLSHAKLKSNRSL